MTGSVRDERRARRRRARVRALAAWCALGATLAPATLSGEPQRPAGARRQVRVFDFEERDVNFEAVPMHWFRVVDGPEGPPAGRPAWNRAGFDGNVRFSGSWSVLLPTKGGGTMLRLGPGVAPAIPGADYVVSAMVRTEGLVHARARLTARLLDARREPVSGSEACGPLLTTGGRWVETAVHIPGEFPEGAWIQIDLELLQPDHYRAPGAGELVFEDVRGGAWFDDVVVQQLPRVELTTRSPGNVIVAPEAPTLVTTVRDLTGESLRGRIEVRGIGGGVEATREFDVAWGGRPTSWTPDLKEYGWRRATLEIIGGSGVVSRSTLDFVYAPGVERAELQEASRFELALTAGPAGPPDALVEVARRSLAGALRAPVWEAIAPGASKGGFERLTDFVEPLLSDGRRVTFCVGGIGLPDAERAASELLAGGAAARAWIARLEPLLERFGQRVRRWQLGDAGGVSTPLGAGVAVAQAEQLQDALARLAPEPEIVVPWPATLEIDPALAAHGATIDAPSEFQAEGLADLARAWPEGANVTLEVEAQPASLVGQRDAAIDLVRRVVEAWRLQPEAIAFRQPWRTAVESVAGVASAARRSPSVMPTPDFAVIRQLVERLSDRRIVARAPAEEGVVAYVLDGPADDAIVAWNERAQPEHSVLRAYLAEGPVRVYDMFGNVRTVEMSGGLHEVRVGQEPVFIEGVDVQLARFRSAVRVEPEFIPSTAERHELRVVLENPWPVALSGRMRVAEPSHWKITPRTQSFTIGPGKSDSLRFEASFGVAEEAGEARMELELELSAERDYPPIRLRPRLEIGLPYVQLAPSYRVERGENGEEDVVVTLVITNVGDRPLTMQAFALAPGFAREQAPVSELAPSDTSVKRFVFRGGGAKLRGGMLRVGLIETDGLGRLNRTLRVE